MSEDLKLVLEWAREQAWFKKAKAQEAEDRAFRTKVADEVTLRLKRKGKATASSEEVSALFAEVQAEFSKEE